MSIGADMCPRDGRSINVRINRPAYHSEASFVSSSSREPASSFSPRLLRPDKRTDCRSKNKKRRAPRQISECCVAEAALLHHPKHHAQYLVRSTICELKLLSYPLNRGTRSNSVFFIQGTIHATTRRRLREIRTISVYASVLDNDPLSKRLWRSNNFGVCIRSFSRTILSR